MSQLRTIPLSMVLVAVTAILTATVEVPRLGAGPIVVRAAAIEAAFRDLPATVLTGEILKIDLDVQNGSTCDGSVVYRDNSEQKLKKIDEEDDRCTWSVIVPENVRRGEADVFVNVSHEDERLTLTSTIDVVRGVEDIAVVLRELPGSVKRGSDFEIRLDVPDKANCKGTIVYEDERPQTLLEQNESRERCRWEMTVPDDVSRGTARVTIEVKTQDEHVTTLGANFEVGREKDGADMLVAFKDLPGSIHRDETLPVRAIVPAGASCSGEVSFRSAPNAKLDETTEQSGLCRWSVDVPDNAKRGDSEVLVKITSGEKEMYLKAMVTIDESSGRVDASFKDLTNSIRRGDDLEVRVSVPDGAECRGDIVFDDGVQRSLDPQKEKRDRCFWSVGVPSRTPRGPAVVRVFIDDHGMATTLISNVMVEGREDDPLAGFWQTMPTQAKIGETFEVVVNVSSGSACVGKITFPEGLKWVLGDRIEENGTCRWTVEVPVHVKTGKAGAEVNIEKAGKRNVLKADLEILK